jgi:hypothetical protein
MRGELALLWMERGASVIEDRGTKRPWSPRSRTGGLTRSDGLCQGSPREFYLAVCGALNSELVAGQRCMPTFVDGLPQTQAAMAYAERLHGGQRRADGTPFIRHPLEVASLLYYSGAPDHLIAAGVMHDLIEKSDATPADLHERFGARITELVLAVTDDDRIAGYVKRKAALRRQVEGAGDEALTLFAADKLSKLRELRRETAVDSTGSAAPAQVRQLRARRVRHYQRSLALLEERLHDSSLVRELRDELAMLLRAQPTLARTR